MSNTRYSSPARFCDIVMKGGITSGVVYPLAVCELAPTYRFKNIGGTSAGAIAAAAAAAAEYGRAQGGFEKLEELPQWLGQTNSAESGSNLFSLFQPQAETKPIFDTLVAGLGGGPDAPCRVFWAAALAFPVGALLGAAPGLGLMVLAYLQADGLLLAWSLVAGILLLAAGLGSALAFSFVSRAMKALPKNNYGLCTGMNGVGAHYTDPLTAWLTDYLDDLAGNKSDRGVRNAAEHPPLTFGNLWWPEVGTGKFRPGQSEGGDNAPPDEGGSTPDEVRVSPEREINLEMMTTCLTHGRPYRLPFRDDKDVRENSQFYFDSQEFRRFFPERVVNWMVEHARKSDEAAAMAEFGLCALPEPWNLPVVVAVRMSLSFPVLLSAVPLYAVDRTRRNERDRKPEHCWFSDGGICSNFPLHFFDAPLPRWPTFGINLSEKHPDYPIGVWMPDTNRKGINEWWHRFEGQGELRRLFGFLGAILRAMQNWGDATQSRLPGYRDRIAHVSLGKDEGGLNLNMPDSRIHELSQRGEQAGKMFVERFASPNPRCVLDWKNHRWVRLRTWLACLEDMLLRFELACSDPKPGDLDYETWVATTPAKDLPSYKWTEAQQEFAIKVIRSLRALTKTWKAEGGDLAEGSPRPRPELRKRPRI